MNINLGIALDELSPALAKFPNAQNAFVKSVLARAAVPIKHNAPDVTSRMTTAMRHRMLDELTGEIVVDTNYAGFVHNGRMPGKVDPEAIEDWAKVKGLPEGAAYPIARKIAREGTEGEPWISDYIEGAEFRSMVDAAFNRELARAMA